MNDELKQWLDISSGAGKMAAPRMESLRPDIGFFIRVDVVDVPKELFPDEYAQIRAAYISVLDKMAKHFDEKIRK